MKLTLDEVLRIVDSDEEFEGHPPLTVLIHAIFHPIKNTRMACVLTKESIGNRIMQAEYDKIMDMIKVKDRG